MATLVLSDLAPGRSATLQLFERDTNTPVGSIINGTSVGTTYSFAGVPDAGDYDAQLAGFSSPNGARFPVRNGVGYPGVAWSVVDEIDASPATPTTFDFIAPVDADYEVVRNLPFTIQPSYFVLTDANQKQVATITPTRNGARYTLTIPRAHTTKQRTLYWALRSTTDANTIYDSGTIRFDYAATESS
jgi:hypothetical protein